MINRIEINEVWILKDSGVNRFPVFWPGKEQAYVFLGRKLIKI
jgi:hypothetical protein